MATSIWLLRNALWQLSLEPAEQRQHLRGAVVTDELVLDLSNAVEALAFVQDTAGLGIEPEVAAELQRLLSLLEVPRGDPLWADESLDRHPKWEMARKQSRQLLRRLPKS
jgi:hypothetical protein